jgi:hypothetical protein
MRGCGDLSAEIFPGRMTIDVKALLPERALGDIIDLPLKGNIDGMAILSVET